MRKIILAVVVLIIVLLSLQIVLGASLTKSTSLGRSTASSLTRGSAVPVMPPVSPPPMSAPLGFGTPTTQIICGDADANGVINILDALMIARVSSGALRPPYPVGQGQCMDVDGNAAITIIDALRVAQSAAGIPYTIATGCDPACLNNPYGRWVRSIDTSTVKAPAIIDVDNDGDLDVLAMPSIDFVYAWDYDGNQIFRKLVSSDQGPNVGLAVSDLIVGSSYLEKEIVLAWYTGQIILLRKDTSWRSDLGFFGSPIQGYIMNDPIIANVDTDPEMEVIIISTDLTQVQNYLTVYENDGTLKTQIVISGTAGGPARAIAVGNVDSDPANEIVIAAQNDNIIVVDDDLATVNLISSTPINEDIVDMILVNVDGDTESEIFYVTSDSGQLSGRVNVIDGTGLMPNMPGSRWPAQISNNPRSHIVAGDINNDGSKEIVVTASEAGIIYWYNSLGILLQSKMVGRNPASPVIANIDDDVEYEIVLGVSDIALDGSIGDAGVIAFNYDGSKLPFYPMALPQTIPSEAIHTAVDDLDGDGKADIVVVSNRLGGSADVSVINHRDTYGGSLWSTYRQNNQRTGSI